MASPVESRPAPPASDWTVQVADTIESVVGSIRNKTTVPVETVARALVYGVLIATLGLVALALFSIGLVRLLDNWFKVWFVYALVGGLFTALGMLCWSFRRPRKRGGKE